MKKIMLLIAGVFLTTLAYATLTNGVVPVTKSGTSNPPTLQNGSITDTGTAGGAGNVGINYPSPTDTLDVGGTAKATLFSGSGKSLFNLTGSGINWTNVRVYGTIHGGDHSGINWQSFGV